MREMTKGAPPAPNSLCSAVTAYRGLLRNEVALKNASLVLLVSINPSRFAPYVAVESFLWGDTETPKKWGKALSCLGATWALIWMYLEGLSILKCNCVFQLVSHFGLTTAGEIPADKWRTFFLFWIMKLVTLRGKSQIAIFILLKCLVEWLGDWLLHMEPL